MRHVPAALAAALLAIPAWGDEILLKDGKTIEWVSIRDAGDSYEIETPHGARKTVNKSDIDRVIVIPRGTVPLTGATFTRLRGKTRAFNCLQHLDLKNGFFGTAGEFKQQKDNLICDLRCDSPARLQIPIKLTEEYDFTITLEKKDGLSDFFIGLVGGGKTFLLLLDADGRTRAGIAGHRTFKPVMRPILETNVPVTVNCQIRAGSLLVVAEKTGPKGTEKTEIINWTGDWSEMPEAPETHRLPENRAYIFVGSQKVVGSPANRWHLSRMVLTTKE